MTPISLAPGLWLDAEDLLRVETGANSKDGYEPTATAILKSGDRIVTRGDTARFLCWFWLLVCDSLREDALLDPPVNAKAKRYHAL